MIVRKTLLPMFTALALSFLAPSVRAAIKTATFNDTTYVSFADWAKANRIGWGWVKRDETLYATNGDSKLLFSVKSREARVNNIDVWLLFPLVNGAGGIFISQIDANKTISPVLFPSRNASGKKVKTICIDPGHGGKDPGNRVGKLYEKEYTFRLANELSSQLKKAGFKVILTRTRDKFVELSDRPAAAAKTNADLFISLHFNAAGSGASEANGAETYALTPSGARSTAAAGKGDVANSVAGNRFDQQNMLLAYEIQNRLVRSLSAADRGVRRARFQVLREASMPAVLIEGGFMSHPVEGKKIFDAAYRREMARAITDGILSYKRAVEGTN